MVVTEVTRLCPYREVVRKPRGEGGSDLLTAEANQLGHDWDKERQR